MLRLLQRSPKATNTAGSDDEPMPLALLEFQSPTAAVLAMPVPRIARYSNYLITAMVLCLMTVAATMPIDEMVTATGELTSTAATGVIQPFVTSIVKSIIVTPGEFVRKGQVLATLDPTYAAADLTALTSQSQAYSAQVAQLQAQENGTPYTPDPTNPASALQLQTYEQQVGEYNFTMADYVQKIKSLQTQIDGYNAQAQFFQQRLAVASNVEEMRKDLQNLQVGSKLDTLAATDDRLSMQSSLATALSSATQAGRDLAAQEAERDAFAQQWKANISQQLETAINDLTQAQQALAKAKLNDQLLELTAPQDSVVLSVSTVSNGSVVQSGDTLMQLIPVNAPMTVNVEVEGSNAGYVQPGDVATIEFQTLPFLEYGAAKGMVKSISPDSFNPLNQGGPTSAGPPLPGTPQELYYNTEISLEELNLHNTPKGFQIVPGMPLTVYLKVGTRTIMQYFAHRFMPIAYDSMHEP